MDLQLLWIIQLAPVIAFVLIQLLPKNVKKTAPIVGIVCSLTAAVASIWLFLLNTDRHALPKEFVYKWLFVSDQPLWPFVSVTRYDFSVGFLVDPLNLLMITLVTTISFFVQVFSYYYMAEDESRPRYFAFLSFFSFSMTGLVLSHNLLQTFLFWELVGLTSYLLIGFWYQKQSAATAARKAFVINRLADLGFYLGIIALFILTGTLNFMDLNPEFLHQMLPASTITLIGILVLLGVMGKSAQFPFHNWLPDAMEGPTPVSALIHSATMVAAGVFLLHRAFGLFSASEITLFVVLVVGSLTAFVGASVATVQRDIKKILAYSTISQLGLMVMAVGAGSSIAGMFHLSTHAYFKSLLFLTAGAFIHHFHTNDIWEIGKKGAKYDRLSVAVLCLGLFSLCGIPPFAGFFSKDMILEALKERNLFFYGVALFVSFLTVYYSFRLLFVILRSKVHTDTHHSPLITHHASFLINICRALPLVSLALISLYVGALGTPLFGHKILHWLGGHEPHLNMGLILTTGILIAAGAGLAFLQFKNPATALDQLENRKTFLQIVLERKFFIDELYEFLVKQIGLRIAAALDRFDKGFITGVMVNQTSYSIMRLGRAMAKIQNGLLQDYIAWAAAGGALILFYLTKGL